MKFNFHGIKQGYEKCLIDSDTNKRLKQSDVLVYQYLCLSATWHSSGIYTGKLVSVKKSMKNIAFHSFCSVRSAKSATKKLEQMGWIESDSPNRKYGNNVKTFVILGAVQPKEEISQSQFEFERNPDNEKWEKVIQLADRFIKDYPRKGKSGTVKQIAQELDRICNPEKNPNPPKVDDLMVIAKRYCRDKGDFALGLYEFLKQDAWRQWI